jgi:hypothetical protein
MATGGCFLGGGGGQMREADHSPQSSGQARMVSYTSTTPHAFMAQLSTGIILHYPESSQVAGQRSITRVSRSSNMLLLIPGENYKRLIIAGIMIGKGKLKYSAKCLPQRHFLHVNSHAERAQVEHRPPVRTFKIKSPVDICELLY